MNNLQELSGPINRASVLSKNLVIFLHGWGSDGNDLIQISHHWRKALSHTTFLAPNGPEQCLGNPSGRQWFNILTENNVEIFDGLKKSFSLLNVYIDQQLKIYNLKHDDFFLVGFSQGTMLSLHASLRRKCKGVIGYSGAFLDNELPEKIIKNDILLVHGELDNIVPITKMEQAKLKLKNMSNKLESKKYNNLEHSINEDGLLLGCDFIKKRL